MLCPRCNKTLIIVERHQIELDYCMTCKGFWFDQDEWRHLSEALDVQMTFPDMNKYPPAMTQDKKIRCPRCLARMVQLDLGRARPPDVEAIADVIVDSCPNSHGLWFDKGELGRVVEGLSAKARPVQEKMISFLGEFINLKNSVKE